MDQLKAQHDELLAMRPEEMTDEQYSEMLSKHKDTCQFCNEEKIQPIEGGDMETFTKEDVEAKINEAVTPLLAEIEGLKNQITQNEADTEVAAKVAEAEAAKEEVQGRLDIAVAEAQAAKDELAALVAFLEAEVVEAAAREAFELVKADRVKQIQDVANFTEDYINDNIDRWMKDSDEEFALRLSELSQVSTKSGSDEGGAESAALDTAIKITRPAASGKVDFAGALGTLQEATRSGININRIK